MVLKIEILGDWAFLIMTVKIVSILTCACATGNTKAMVARRYFAVLFKDDFPYRFVSHCSMNVEMLNVESQSHLR